MTAAHGQEFTSPDDLLSSLYFNYLSGQPVTNFEPYFSDSLTAEMGGGLVPVKAVKQLGFDPISDMDKPELMTVFNLDTFEAKGLTATSTASFRTDGQLVTIKFDLVHERRHGWQIDHISGTAGDLSWCSNDLVAAVRSAATR
jgi:hypothetical protein